MAVYAVPRPAVRSHIDTFGDVVLEAMANGLPVLAPAHLALNELVCDHTGLLFPPENMLYGRDTACRFPHIRPPPRHFPMALSEPSEAYVAGIAVALARLSEDPDMHARLAAGALAEVSCGRFSTGRRREALREVYTAAAS